MSEAAAAVLSASDAPLVDVYDALLVDLDGVVQLGDQPVAGVSAVLTRLHQRGYAVAYVTNNAARSPDDVASHLTGLGVPATSGQVMTSAMAAADLLARDLPPGSPVLVVGGTGLWSAVEAAGLDPVSTADAGPVAVVQGWGPDVAWADLAEATVALRAGARWVVTNRDLTLPSPRGPLPGSGSLIAAVVAAIGQEPAAVAGKPHPPLFEAAMRRSGGARPLVVGDRLDTDIAGAVNAGMPSLAVLTGVSDRRALLTAADGARPTYLGCDLGAVELAHPAVTMTGDGATCRAVTVTARGEVRPIDPPSAQPGGGDGLDGLRAACALAWAGVLPPEQYDTVLYNLEVN